MKSAAAEQRREQALARDRLPDRLLDAADVGGDEDVEHHHRAGVDHHLRGGDELGVQEQEEPRERDEVDDQREHAVEGVAKRDHRDRAAERADRPGEEGRPPPSPLLALSPQRRPLDRLREQHLLGEDQVLAVVVRHLVLVAHRDRVERAGDLAVAAEDAAARLIS